MINSFSYVSNVFNVSSYLDLFNNHQNSLYCLGWECPYYAGIILAIKVLQSIEHNAGIIGKISDIVPKF